MVSPIIMQANVSRLHPV